MRRDRITHLLVRWRRERIKRGPCAARAARVACAARSPAASTLLLRSSVGGGGAAAKRGAEDYRSEICEERPRERLVPRPTGESGTALRVSSCSRLQTVIRRHKGRCCGDLSTHPLQSKRAGWMPHSLPHLRKPIQRKNDSEKKEKKAERAVNGDPEKSRTRKKLKNAEQTARRTAKTLLVSLQRRSARVVSFCRRHKSCEV